MQFEIQFVELKLQHHRIGDDCLLEFELVPEPEGISKFAIQKTGGD
jgi:hypothetical protein